MMKKSLFHSRRKKVLIHRRQDSSITGDVVSGAGDLESRIQTTLNKIRTTIPTAIESVENDIAISNRDKVILALANFLGSMCFLSHFKDNTGASLERVPRVPRHPLRFGNGCLAPVLIIYLDFERSKIRPDIEV